MLSRRFRHWLRQRATPRPRRARARQPIRLQLERLEDWILPSMTFMVTSTADSGANTLRQAILNSNGTSGTNTIKFNIAGTGVHTIQPHSALPGITNPVIIDGTSQPNYAGTPLIEINGALAGTSVDGLDISAGGCTVKGLAINGFSGDGIAAFGGNGDTFTADFLGTDPSGTISKGNGVSGILIESANNTVGGTTAATRNLLSGNAFSGIQIANNTATGNVVEGNYVGTNLAGTAALPNAVLGVIVNFGAQNNTIGGTSPGAGNLISGNTQVGVQFQSGGTSGNLVLGNLIGTNAAGTAALANGIWGVLINGTATNNTVGGSVPGARNVISGNAQYGIEISDAGTTGDAVEGNFIGTDASGTSPVANGIFGVYVHSGATNDPVGGSAALANTIAFNAQAGVAVQDDTTAAISVRANAIFGNGGLGIDLGNSGVQVNHLSTTTGPNNLQNYPLLTAGTPGASTTISGLFNSLPSTTYTLDFYANSTHDVTFYGPGQRYLGSTSVTTDASGNASFSVTLFAATSTGDWVSATATDPNGNTSEFSGDRQLPATPLSLNSASWTPIGPGPIAQSPEYTGPVMSGRIETAAPDPTNPNLMYITADGGGVWKTANWQSPSPTWTPLTDSQSSTVTGAGDLSYKSIAVFPSNPSLIYAAASGPGGGILKSTDAGATWTLLGSPVFGQVAFGSLIIDPNNANNLFVTVWYGPNANSGGVYKSTDGGVTWTNTTAAIHTGIASDVIMDPSNSSVLYAGLTDFPNSLGQHSTTNGLYKSTNGGATWTLVGGGLLTGSAVGTAIRIAIAPSSPHTLYATVFDPALGPPPSPPDGLPHRFSSTNGGATWTSLPGLPTNEEPRYWHVMLSVDPSNPQTIYVNGDHSVYESTTGGTTWTQINNSEDPVGGFFDDTGALILVGDHGIYRGTNFVNEQGNLQTSEFYTLTLDPTNPNVAYGLAQDQFAANKYTGYAVWNSTGQAPNNQDGGGAGETGKIVVNPNTPSRLYRYAPTDTTSFILVSNDGGASWSESGTGIPTTLAGFGLAYASQKSIVMDPSNGNRLLVGTNQVYQTTNGAGSWTAISPVLSPSSTLSDQYITSLAVAPSAPNTIYAATADGHVWSTQNDGGAWAEVDGGLPKDFFDQIVSMQVDPSNPNRVFIVPGRFPTNVFGNAHVWMTTTGGVGTNGWTDITGNLPGGDWTNSIAVDWRPTTPVLYVATARGVYRSTNLGGSWSLFGLSLPNSPVTDLQIDTTHNLLAAATYGRGVWEIALGAATRVWTGASTTSSNWSDPANWAGAVAPAAGDNLVFGPGAARLTNTDDFANGTAFGSITFSAAGYSIGGNSVTVSGNLDGSTATGNNTFNPAVTLANGAGVLVGPASTDLTLGGTINDGATFTVSGGVGRVDFTGAITGAGGLTVNDAGGTVALSGPADTYTGTTTVSAGTLLLNKAGANPGPWTVPGGTVRLLSANQTAASAAVTISASGLLDLNNNADSIGSLTLSTGTVTTGTGTLTLGGNVTDTGASSIAGSLALGTAARTFTVNSSSTLTVSAVVSGSASLTKASTGTLVLSAANTYTGVTTLSAGTLAVGDNSALGTGGLTMATGTTLSATGSAVTLPNAVTLNGNVTFAGTVGLTLNASITLTANRTLTVNNTAGLTLQGGVTESGGSRSLTKAGSGKLILPVADSYSGGTTFSGGTLVVGNNAALGSGTLTFTSGTLSATGAAVTLANAVTLAGNPTIAGSLALSFTGPVTLTGNRTLTVTNTAPTTLAGAVGQSGGSWKLTKAGSGSLVLQAANTYAGGTALTAGTLTIGNNSALGTGALTITTGTITATGGPITLANAVTLGGNFTIAGSQALSFSGAATLTGTRTITVTNTASTTLAGSIGQSVAGLGLTKAGTGTLVLSGANSYTGTTTVMTGTLLANGSQAGSAVSVKSGATLAGTGTVGTITAVSGAHVAPGAGAGLPGILTAAAVTLPSGSIFNVALNGTTTGSGYSQLSASGTINLTGSTLSVSLGFTPAIGNSFTIINNTGAGAIVGTFKNLPQNGTFTQNGMVFQISYTGGDGNDVVLTRIS